MSKFFRKAPRSDSDSSSASDSEDLEDDSQYSQGEDDDLSASRELEVATPPVEDGPSDAIAAAGPNKDLLLHALLEEKCLNDVRKEHAGKSTSESAIVIEARQRYKTLSAQLAHVGLTAAGLDEDVHQAVRQQYRDGLDVFAKTGVRPGSSAKHIRRPQRRLLTGVDGFDANAVNFDNLQIASMPTFPMSLGPYVAQPPLFGSRYTQDFEELGILGKGGYGIVYQCRHKLDGVIYAVKKVPVSESRRQQILIRGQPEIDDLLSELRTLAQLDHPNIVRYFNGWLDYMNLDHPGDVTSANYQNGPTDVDASQSTSFAPGRVIAEASDDHIMFENSTSRNTTTSTSTSSDHDLRRTASHATRATVSDEDVESISRNSESDLLTGTDGLQFDMSKPQLAVHMQMALYPMTLTDFLSSDTSSSTSAKAPPLVHCFHLKPSIRILLAILDGITYLHQNQIVHRDLKPGNIFLAPSCNSRLPDGSVDLSLCDDCDKRGNADPISLKVRIGDFGLVTTLATSTGEEPSSDGPESPSKPPVGTELYSPPDGVRGTASPALDIYAAGIVAVELLCPFGTRMERHETLHSLKSGHFPPDFDERIGDPDGAFKSCVREMLRPDHPPIEELRQRLAAIL